MAKGSVTGDSRRVEACQGLGSAAEYVNMAVQKPTGQVPAASPLFLREAEIRRGIELLYFGYSSLTRSADEALIGQGLGRAHHRALYFIARQPDLTVSALLRLLAVTKQSLGRVLNELMTRGLVETRVGTFDRRQKLLRLTSDGAALEAQLYEALRERLAGAYSHAGQNAVTGFWQVLEGLIPIEDRALAIDLSRSL
jgi:DNA-binding MarR family transcriptional regulator